MKLKLTTLTGLIVLTACAAASPEATVIVPAAASPTYYANIQPIVAQHCVSCHQTGVGAPFSLNSYRDVEKHGQQIALTVGSRCMPPWKPDSHGELVDENRLSASEIVLFQKWSDSGAKAGDPRDARPSPAVSRDNLGPPDAVLSPSKPVNILADGPDFYQCFVLPTHFTGGKYLSAIVFKPGNPNTDDHALEYLDPQKRIRLINSVLPGDGFTVARSTTGLQPSMVIGGWGICTTPQRFPNGAGIFLPQGSDLVLEVHYHSTGKPEQDLPKVQLYFCKGPVDQQVRVAPVTGSQFRLNTRRFMPGMPVGGQRPLVSSISILGVLPYMRSQGSSIKLGILRSDKSQNTLFNIPSWDFDWIGDYRFKTPVRVSSGSLLLMSANFGAMHQEPVSTSYNNRGITTWGDTLNDENAAVYVFYTTDREHLKQNLPADGIPALGGANNAALDRILLDMFDTNKDGRIDSQEQQAMRSIFGPNMPHTSGMDLM